MGDLLGGLAVLKMQMDLQQAVKKMTTGIIDLTDETCLELIVKVASDKSILQKRLHFNLPRNCGPLQKKLISIWLNGKFTLTQNFKTLSYPKTEHRNVIQLMPQETLFPIFEEMGINKIRLDGVLWVKKEDGENAIRFQCPGDEGKMRDLMRANGFK